MAVLIKDLKMPEKCIQCPLCIKYGPSNAYCNALEADINANAAKLRRMVNCPLIEIDRI